MSTKLLDLAYQSSRESISARDEDQLLYLLVSVKRPQIDSAEYLPRNLSLIIDCSTSMKGDRLNNVKSAAVAIVEGIGPQDKISIVPFSDRAEVIYSADTVQNKKVLISQINSMSASGGTEIYQGLEKGYNEIRKSRLDSYSNHMILLTDGRTYGDTKECLNLANEAADRGVDINAFGIGADWNDAFLDKLVAISGSQAIYIEKPSQAMGHLQDKIEGLGDVFAANFRLIDDFPENIALLSVFKISPYAQHFTPDGLDIRLGSLEAGSPLAILLELQVQVDNSSEKFQIPIKLLSDIPSKHIKNYAIGIEFDLPVGDRIDPVDPPVQVVEAVRALNLYRMNERIWRDIEGGDIPLATRRLHQFSTRLLEAGHVELAEQIQLETERLKVMGAYSESNRKRLKYGTRALITQNLGFDS